MSSTFNGAFWGARQVSTPADEFVNRIAALCQEGRHTQAVAHSDRHGQCWSALSLAQMGSVYSQLIRTALANVDQRVAS